MGGQYEVKDGATKKYYSIAGMMVAVNDGTALQYLLTDHLGSTVAVTNSSGTLTSQQRYLPFGAPRTISNSPIAGTDFTYTGQRKLDDGMGGIMDYKARFYSPALMRFLQPDSVLPDPSNPQNFNRYSYARNNPILYNDPSGHCAVFCVIALAGIFFIFNGTSDSDQSNVLSPSELESRQSSVELGVALIVTALSIKVPGIGEVSDIYECAKGNCNPAVLAPGPVTLYSKLDDVDAPRMSLSQMQKLDQLAQDNNCSITICGGYAETALGIENRTIAFNLAPGQTRGPVPWWRNNGEPTGKDLDFWTPFGNSLPKPVQDGLAEIFGIPPKDNWNIKNLYNMFNTPYGSLTFTGNGSATRKLAEWQKPYNWAEAK
ncbi:MAG: RHS repeat-associated core domain-containing protein [Chloroflexota bacterium]